HNAARARSQTDNPNRNHKKGARVRLAGSPLAQEPRSRPVLKPAARAPCPTDLTDLSARGSARGTRPRRRPETPARDTRQHTLAPNQRLPKSPQDDPGQETAGREHGALSGTKRPSKQCRPAAASNARPNATPGPESSP